MLSVGVVGARRRRQGTGEHVARYFARHGAAVRAIVGTTPETVAEACQNLRDRHGVECRGYTSLADLLDAGPGLDVLAVCSPIAAHREALDEAARRGLHALCEKPLLFDEERDVAADARAIAERFVAAGRYLGTVTQWPFTLEGFRRVYPGADLGRVERFAMRLSPASRGTAMLVDSLSHPLSLLRALVGPGTARVRSIEWPGGSDEAVTVRFGYAPARTGGQVEAEVALRRTEEQPRPASYAIDGLEVRREVRAPDSPPRAPSRAAAGSAGCSPPGGGLGAYAMELVGSTGGRRVAIEDPLSLLVKDFIGRVERGEPTDVDGLASDAAALDAIVKGSVAWNAK